jgi:hypothetical protein
MIVTQYQNTRRRSTRSDAMSLKSVIRIIKSVPDCSSWTLINVRVYVRTITYTVTSFHYANISLGKAILLPPRISLAKHVCLPKRALCICLYGVQKKALSSLTHVRCSTFLVFWTKKKSRWYYLLTRSHISLLHSRRGTGGGTMLQLKVKRGTCRERESCFASFSSRNFIVRIVYTAFTCDVRVDWFCMFVEKDHRCQQHIKYNHIFIFSRLFSIP